MTYADILSHFFSINYYKWQESLSMGLHLARFNQHSTAWSQMGEMVKFKYSFRLTKMNVSLKVKNT